MKHHRKTVGKHTQKKNGKRKTMKGGFWQFTSSTSENTPVTTSEPVAPVDTTPSKPFSFFDFFSLPKKTDTPVTPPPLSQIDNNNNNNSINNTGTGGYMGGKRKGKTAKKPCPKKGGGK